MAFVRGNFNSGSTASAITSTFSSNSAGNLLVVGVEAASNSPNVVISDTAGNTWQAAGFLDNGSSWRVIMFYAENCKTFASTNTITATCGGGATFRRIAIAEYSGVATSLSYSNNRWANGSGTALSTGSFSVTSGDLIVAVGFSLGGSIVVGSGFTSREADSFLMLSDETAASSTATGTNSATSGSWSILAVAFHASPAPSQSPYTAGDMIGALGSTSVSAVFPSNTAGDLLIAGIEVSTSSVPTSFTDTAGNTWTLIRNVAGSASAALYYVASCLASSGKNTVTITFSSTTTFKRLFLAEYAGPIGSLVASSGATASGTSLSAGTLASAPGNLIIAAGFGAINNVTPGAGYTSRKADGFMFIEDKISASSSENPSINLPSSALAFIIGASFGSVSAAAQPQIWIIT